jgi:ribosomal protein L37AE/L43A
MIIKENKDNIQDMFVCPHCNGRSFVFIGRQKQKGLFENHELWCCRNCHSTFARETIDVEKSMENETFNKKALQYYCKIRFAN